MIIYDGNAPKKPNPTDAGWDLVADANVVIPAGDVAVVGTGSFLNMSVASKETFGLITGRSGLTGKGIICLNGVIDKEYQGELKCVFLNATDSSFEFKKGERIAQILFLAQAIHRLKPMSRSIWTKTKRGGKGFGSSGS